MQTARKSRATTLRALLLPVPERGERRRRVRSHHEFPKYHDTGYQRGSLQRQYERRTRHPRIGSARVPHVVVPLDRRSVLTYVTFDFPPKKIKIKK